MLDAQLTTDKAPPVGPVRDFGPNEAALLLRNVAAARSILHAVALAAKAQLDGSIEYKNNYTGRWQPALDEVCSRLEAVRDVLIETRSAPSLDWFTPLTLAEAIAAALWHGLSMASAAGRLKGEGLDEVELETIAQVVIESLDSLMGECEREGVIEMVRADKAVSLH